MPKLLTASFLLFPFIVFSQDWRYEEFIPKYKYEILDSANLEDDRTSRILRDLSFIGAYQELYERDTDHESDITEQGMDLLANAELHNAKDYILSHTSERQILILNESHHRPEHRIFTTSLLEELYGQGFRYLGMEAIFSNQHSAITKYPENQYYLGDTTIMKIGYPLMKACSGTYVKEPQFGNMIRKAIDLGFQLFAYEKNGKGRERGQAENIARVFEMDPEAKIVVHCGYGHIVESPMADKRGKRMAGFLKKITGIDPLTVDQTYYDQSGKLLAKIFESTKATQPQVLLQNNAPFVSFDAASQNRVDMTIFHQPITFKNDRPSWLFNQPKNRTFIIKASDIFLTYPLRIKLLAEDDRLDAVAIDILEVDTAEESYLLYGEIREGKIVIENKAGNRQVINVKANK